MNLVIGRCRSIPIKGNLIECVDFYSFDQTLLVCVCAINAPIDR